jgi:hypothetical protein
MSDQKHLFDFPLKPCRDSGHLVLPMHYGHP